ncbi:transposase [Streptomyces aurantiacus]|nr:transposase [Streptomyces aurantiacus]
MSDRKPYSSDVSDEQWALVEPVITAGKAGHPSVSGHQGRYAMREIVNAILYQNRSGCQGDQLPHDLPPAGAVKYYFYTWRDDGTDQTIQDLLRWQLREKRRRLADPSLVILDTQSIHAAVGVPATTTGKDTAKKVPGRKRCLAVDVLLSSSGCCRVVGEGESGAGEAADSRGAPKFVSEALATAVEAGCTGTRILRADSQFYNTGVIVACRRARARFSITCGMNPSVKRAVLAIPDQAWQQITYPTAVPDPDTGELIFDAEVAEIPLYTAVRRPEESRTGHRPADRAPRPRPRQTPGDRRAGRVVPRLALPPVLHRQPRRDPPGRAEAAGPQVRQ